MTHIQNGVYEDGKTCVAVGFFDGVHLGHRAIVEKLVKTASAKGLAPVLISFERDNGSDHILTTETEKLHLLEEFGLSAMVSMPPCQVDAPFVQAVLAGQMGAKAIIVGKNSEDLPLLQNVGGEYGLDVVECDIAMDEGQPVCSARIAMALLAGQMDDARRLLGHPHIVMGRVVTGKQLGRTVGQPTANIDFSQNKRLPPDGSYVTVTLVNGVRRVGLTNIGKRPTVDSLNHTTIENHILDFSEDIYGKQLVVEFHRFMRGVEKFNTLAEVQAQVAKDVQSIRSYIDSVG